MRRLFLVMLLVAGQAMLCLTTPTIVPSDGFNLTVTKASATDVTTTLQVKTYAHNWFAGRFSGLARGRETTIRVDMKGNDTVGNKANVGKWKGLRPLYTYADPTQYDAYTAYTRNEQGLWISSDPFKKGAAKRAGSGLTPLQNVMPPAVAPEFLSQDGLSWFPWQEIETAKPGPNNTFVIRHSFALPSASVVMRVPFTYLEQFIARLQAAQLPSITVDEIGETSAKRKLWCIRVEDPTGTASKDDLRTVAVFAREHATEHATSWSVLGVLRGLLNDAIETEEMRMKTRWLLVPLQDPDGANISRFDGMTDRWDDPKNNTRLQEVMAYWSNYVTSEDMFNWEHAHQSSSYPPECRRTCRLGEGEGEGECLEPPPRPGKDAGSHAVVVRCQHLLCRGRFSKRCPSRSPAQVQP